MKNSGFYKKRCPLNNAMRWLIKQIACYGILFKETTTFNYLLLVYEITKQNQAKNLSHLSHVHEKKKKIQLSWCRRNKETRRKQPCQLTVSDCCRIVIPHPQSQGSVRSHPRWNISTERREPVTTGYERFVAINHRPYATLLCH